jgi:hypothetical protein
LPEGSPPPCRSRPSAGAALTYFVVILLAGSALRALAERWRTRIYA